MLCKDKILPRVHLLVLVDIYKYHICNYRLSDNFRDDLIFGFFAISFKSQITEYAEIISSFIFYKKLFNTQKMTDAN